MKINSGGNVPPEFSDAALEMLNTLSEVEPRMVAHSFLFVRTTVLWFTLFPVTLCLGSVVNFNGSDKMLYFVSLPERQPREQVLT